jgi:hypothetical protein
MNSNAAKISGMLLTKLEPVAAMTMLDWAKTFKDSGLTGEDVDAAVDGALTISMAVSMKRQADALKEIAKFFRSIHGGDITVISDDKPKANYGDNVGQKQLAPPTQPSNW